MRSMPIDPGIDPCKPVAPPPRIGGRMRPPAITATPETLVPEVRRLVGPEIAVRSAACDSPRSTPCRSSSAGAADGL